MLNSYIKYKYILLIGVSCLNEKDSEIFYYFRKETARNDLLTYENAIAKIIMNFGYERLFATFAINHLISLNLIYFNKNKYLTCF